MRRLLIVLTVLLAARAAYAAACAESPAGTFTCEKFVARDANTTGNNLLTLYPNVSAASPPTCDSVTNWRFFDSDNTSGKLWNICGTTTVMTGTDNVTRFIVKGASGQTAALQTWTTNGDATVASVGIGGVITGAGFTEAIATKTSTYPITLADSTILANGTFTVTLPTAASIAGRTFTIKNIGTGVVTVATTSSQTIDGSLTQIINAQYNSMTVISNGSNWFIK